MFFLLVKKLKKLQFFSKFLVFFHRNFLLFIIVKRILKKILNYFYFLGTLCHLVSEIGELRRENKKFQRLLSSLENNSNKKFCVPQPCLSRNPTPTTKRNVVHRVNAFLDRSNRLNTLSRFICSSNNNCPMMSSGSSSGIFNNPRSTLTEVKQGAKERLSSPPRVKDFNQNVCNILYY